LRVGRIGVIIKFKPIGQAQGDTIAIRWALGDTEASRWALDHSKGLDTDRIEVDLKEPLDIGGLSQE
jgi:hypothetical protein